MKLSVTSETKPDNVHWAFVIIMVGNDVAAIATFGTRIRSNQFAFACCFVDSGKSSYSLWISLPIFNLSIIKVAVILVVVLPFILFATVTAMACKSIMVTPRIIELLYGQASVAHAACFLSCGLNIFKFPVSNPVPIFGGTNTGTILAMGRISAHLPNTFVEF